MSERPSWLDDPRLARRLSQLTWVVLVMAFVLLGRGGIEPSLQRAALAGLIVVVGFLNAPTAIGLWKSRAESGSSAFRAVAFVFVVRLVTAGWLVWVLTP